MSKLQRYLILPARGLQATHATAAVHSFLTGLASAEDAQPLRSRLFVPLQRAQPLRRAEEPNGQIVSEKALKIVRLFASAQPSWGTGTGADSQPTILS